MAKHIPKWLESLRPRQIDGLLQSFAKAVQKFLEKVRKEMKIEKVLELSTERRASTRAKLATCSILYIGAS